MPTRNLLDALRALQRRRKDALKLTTLRLYVKAGVKALDRGDFTEVDDAELEICLEECRGSTVQRLD
jgi:antitoxin ParD1/3/4